jgi:hypothetical protein
LYWYEPTENEQALGTVEHFESSGALRHAKHPVGAGFGGNLEDVTEGAHSDGAGNEWNGKK